MSKINVNTWEPESSTAMTMGASGDTTTVPSGASLVVASGATINITGATQTGFPAGGNTAASQWRLTTDFANTATPIASNLEEVDAPLGFGILGSSMTESSGIFTFPATGYWLLTFNGYFEFVANESNARVVIQTTTNNSTYADASTSGDSLFNYASGAIFANASTSYIFDVTDVSTHKVRFTITMNTATTITHGDTAVNETCMTFIKLGDT